MRNIVLGLLLIFSMTGAFAVEATKFTNPNKAIAVSPTSPEVTLKMKSNPTTGYSWFLINYDHNLLTPTSHKFVPPTEELAGASGYEVWQFDVNSQAFAVPQITKITLEYARPWTVPTNGRKLTFVVVITPSEKHVASS